MRFFPSQILLSIPSRAAEEFDGRLIATFCLGSTMFYNRPALHSRQEEVDNWHTRKSVLEIEINDLLTYVTALMSHCNEISKAKSEETAARTMFINENMTQFLILCRRLRDFGYLVSAIVCRMPTAATFCFSPNQLYLFSLATAREMAKAKYVWLFLTLKNICFGRTCRVY